VKGKAEVALDGPDGTILAYGATVAPALGAALKARERGLRIKVVNLRFAKPLDEALVVREISRAPVVLVAEDGALAGGLGSAVLEAACEADVETRNVFRIGLPDRFLEQGRRDEILSEVGLDADGILARLLEQVGSGTIDTAAAPSRGAHTA
jgi:1-deoxy-D-xylulose-5-phosphate synthase